MAFPALEGRPGTAPVPDLASGPPEVTPDGLSYRFRLRAGAAFGEPANRPVTATDVRAGIERLLDLKPPAPLAGYFHVISGAAEFVAGKARKLSGIATPDERTVEIRLTKPYNDLPWMLALPAASAVPAEIGGKASVSPAELAPSGPYRLDPKDGYRPESGIHLVRNPAWRADSDVVRKAWMDEVEVAIGIEPENAGNGIRTGRLDLVLDTPPQARIDGASSPEGAVHAVPSGCLRYLWLNTRVAPFASSEERRSVAVAVDRGAVLDAVTDPQGAVVATSVLPRTVYGRPENPSAAPAPTVSLAPGVRRTPLRLVVGDRPEDTAAGEAVAASIERAAPYDVEVATLPIASLYVDGYEVPARRIQMGIATWCADWPGLAGRAMLTPLLDGRRIPREGNMNYAQLHDGGLERLLDAAAVAAPAKAEAAWRAAAAAAERLGAWVPLLDLNEVVAVSDRLGGFRGTSMYPRGDLSAVWLRPGRADGTLRPTSDPETMS